MPRRSEPSRIVGILGGMGPAATVDFYAKLVAATPATRDQDHLRVVIWADPTVPNRHEALLHDAEDPTPWLERGVEHLLGCGAEILVVPCNTAHAFMPPVVDGRDVEFIDIVDTAVAKLQRAVPQGPAGLLAADGAVAAGLYQATFASVDRELILPPEPAQAALMEMIYAVKAGAAGAPERRRLCDLLEELERRGAVAVIAGCTEVSVLLAHQTTSVPVIDPAQVLAEQVVARAWTATS